MKMIKSMTGFGRGKYENEGREYTIEIKSVNHKYSDISVKLPRQISYLEENVRKEISKNISRGKIDVFITMQDYSEKGKSIKINTEIAKVYISELKQLATETGIASNIEVMDISKLPEVLNISNEENEELYWEELQIALKDALDRFISMREIEGNKICEDFKLRINRIKEKVSYISGFSAGLVEEYIVKLNVLFRTSSYSLNFLLISSESLSAKAVNNLSVSFPTYPNANKRLSLIFASTSLGNNGKTLNLLTY